MLALQFKASVANSLNASKLNSLFLHRTPFTYWWKFLNDDT